MDQPPLHLPPRADHGHPAPPEGWRPLSGLCLASFILALVLAVLALLTLWPGVLLPLALGVWALARVDGTRFRGRALAWAAVCVALVGGAVGIGVTLGIHGLAERVCGGMLAALGSERSPEERRRLLEDWLTAQAPREEARARIEARYAQAVERLGGVTGPILSPSVWSGQFPVMVGPGDLVALDEPTGAATVPSPGSALWAKVPFERGTAHFAVLLGDGSPSGMKDAILRLSEPGTPAVVRDVRFFVPRGSPLAKPVAPKDR